MVRIIKGLLKLKIILIRRLKSIKVVVLIIYEIN